MMLGGSISRQVDKKSGVTEVKQGVYKALGEEIEV